MSYHIILEAAFRDDDKQLPPQQPQIGDELMAPSRSSRPPGTVPDGYDPHLLVQSGGSYAGRMVVEFHRAKGRYDAMVI